MAEVVAHTPVGDSNAVQFTYTELLSVTPNSGWVGMVVTLNGYGFGDEQGSSTVTFHDGVTADVVQWSPTAIRVTVPAGAVSGDIVLTIGSGSDSVHFSVVAHLIALNPSRGKPGITVQVIGTGFGAVQEGVVVRFGSLVAEVLSWSDTLITVIVPAVQKAVVVRLHYDDGAESNGLVFRMLLWCYIHEDYCLAIARTDLRIYAYGAFGDPKFDAKIQRIREQRDNYVPSGIIAHLYVMT